jgi:hypothetical protein
LRILTYHSYDVFWNHIFMATWCLAPLTVQRPSYGHLRPFAYYPAPYRTRPPVSETPNPTWMIEVLKDLRAFAEHNGYDASVTALEEAKRHIALEIEQRRKADGDFPERGDNFTIISRDR